MRKLIASIVTIITLFAVACTSSTTPIAGGGTEVPNFVKGRVSQDELSSDSKVFLLESLDKREYIKIDSTTVDSIGGYSFELVSSGSYAVEVISDSLKSSITFDFDNSVGIELTEQTLKAVGAVKVSLVVEPGIIEELNNVRIVLDSTPYSADVEGNGYAEMGSIPEGLYTLLVIYDVDGQEDVLCSDDVTVKPKVVNTYECVIVEE